MALNYLFITPSNFFQKFSTASDLMARFGYTRSQYFTTFIIPVMTFNLIKWSAISVITGVTQIKLPERFASRYDSRENVVDHSCGSSSDVKLEASIEK